MIFNRKWNELRRLGNTSAMRATVLVPIIGYLIIFNDSVREYLHLAREYVPNDPILALITAIFSSAPSAPTDSISALQAYRLHCLYFGGCLLGFGQMIFAWKCPDYVKRHGEAYEFVARERAIMHPIRAQNMLQQIVAPSVHHFANLHSVNPSAIKFVPSGLFPRDEKRKFFTAEFLKDKEVEDSPEIAAALTDLQEHFNNLFTPSFTVENVMTEWFVPQKDVLPGWRTLVYLLYCAGFVLLTLPALGTFLAVSRNFLFD